MGVLLGCMLGFISVLFLSIRSPLSMGVSLGVYSLVGGIMLGSVGGCWWNSYLLILVFLGGVMVITSYVVSLVPNNNMGLGGGSLLVGGALGLLMGWMSIAESLDAGGGEGISGVLWGLGWSFSVLWGVCYLLLVLLSVVKVSQGGGAFRAIS